MDDIHERLAAPFPAKQIGWRAAVTSQDKTRCMAVPYIDARDVQNRLDAVLGVGNWQTEFEVLASGCVVCRLSLFIDGRWVVKSDVGSPSDQVDPGDKVKAAFSDSLKRAAIQAGVGRYLYYIDAVWVEYDAQKKQLKGTPALPKWALPKELKTPAVAKPPVSSQAVANGATERPPTLKEFVEAEDRLAVIKHQCNPGDLIDLVRRAAKLAGFPDNMDRWGKKEEAIIREAVLGARNSLAGDQAPPINKAQQKELLDRLAKAGSTWEQAMKYISKPADFRCDLLTPLLWRILMHSVVEPAPAH